MMKERERSSYNRRQKERERKSRSTERSLYLLETVSLSNNFDPFLEGLDSDEERTLTF